MDEHLQPNLLNNIDMQPQQDMQKNNTMEIEQQNKQQFDPMNPQMLVGQQGVQQQGNQQLGNQQVGKERMERPSMTMQLQQQEAAPTSESLERAADVGFEEGINSRKGSCESRNTKRKKAQARNRLNGQGLTAHSGKLSEQLKAYEEDKQAGMQENRELVQQYRDMADKKEAAADKDMSDRYDYIRRKAAKPLMPFIKDDTQLCKDLMGLNREKCINAYHKLMDRCMEFKLDENALCTLSAVQRAVDIKRQAEFGKLVYAFSSYVAMAATSNMPGYTGPQVDRNKVNLFDAYKQALTALGDGTACVVRLQGIDTDGTVLNTFGEKITSAEERTMRADREQEKLNKAKWTGQYQQHLAKYNKMLKEKKN